MPRIVFSRNYCTLETPYNRGFVVDIKTIPPLGREFDEYAKTWRIYNPYVPDALRIMYTHFAGITEVSRDMWEAGQGGPADSGDNDDDNDFWEQAQKTHGKYAGGQFGGNNPFTQNAAYKPANGTPDPETCDPVRYPYDVLHLRSTAPQTLIDAAYKALAKALHPDLNPHDPSATDKMQRVTLAYATLKKLRGSSK